MAKGNAATLTLDEFRAAIKPRGTCSLAEFLVTLSPADASVARQAVMDRSIPSTVVARVLGQHNFGQSHQVISRHRNRDCPKCGTRA